MSQQHPWGSSRQQSNRLPPISTAQAFAHQHDHRRSTPSPSGSRSAVSPALSSFPSLPASAARHVTSSRKSSAASSSPSLFSPSLAGQQPPPSQLLSSRGARTITPQPQSQLASSAASLPAAVQGGGVGAHSTGGGATKLSRDSPALSASSTVGSPNTSSNAASSASLQTQNVTKIVIAQVFLLLSQFGPLKDERDRTKQAEQIRKLVDSHGMEVFTKYFRRLIQQSAPHIFQNGPRNPDPNGSYNFLASEMHKLSTDPEQPAKIAESIDCNEGDLFRDFDLSALMAHFQLDPVAKAALALACRSANKADLRTKADAILSDIINSNELLQAVAQPHLAQNSDMSIETLAAIIERLATDPPNNWNEEKRTNLMYAMHMRYQHLELALPAALVAALHLSDLANGSQGLVNLLQRTGPRATASVEAAKDVLSGAEMRDIGYKQVADVLLFMAILQNGQAYNAKNFVAALREHRTGQRIDWQDVVHAFDRDGLRITKPQFLALYNALHPVAVANESFDIQLMWGGDWQSKITQLSFLTSFLSCTPDELDVTEIPRLRVSYTFNTFESASDDVKAVAERAVKHPYVSLDATTALFRMIFESTTSYRDAQLLGIPDAIINPYTGEFLVSAVAVPKPWGMLQEQALKQLFDPFFLKRLPQYNFVLYGLWQQDRKWLIERFCESYTGDSNLLNLVLEHAENFGWLDALIRSNREISLDLAAQAHARRLFDIEPWLQETYQQMGHVFRSALTTFLFKRSEQELQSSREDHHPAHLTLAVRTVHSLLWFLADAGLPELELLPLQRSCIQAYPRLINYGEGVDDIIDQNGQNGNKLPEEADAKMQEHFKNMYSGDSDVRDIINVLRKYKESQDPAEQDLFACMIHGLFDEYNCFGEYPLEALATTAVLFGGIINFNLLSRIALSVGLAMVLEAVQEYRPEDSMYKFGLQALLHFSNRLPEWPNYCEQLLIVPGLQGTEIYAKAEEVVGHHVNEMNGEAQNGIALTNGNAMDGLLQQAEPTVPKFSCIHVDPPLQPDSYEEPDEEVQDKIRFDLNNISERNVQEKTKDLSKAVEAKHHQWFASYLVEERARMEPKNQPLYLEMLDIFNDKQLWAEVLRETYVAVSRILNSDGQLSAQERGFLKHLGSWLGSLTIARDKPIKFRNISFKDLLIEGYDSDRLLLVIPFTCKVLIQAAHSTVFKWPNPWLKEILQVLMELYHFADLKLNQKFEIEVLCKGLDVDPKTVEPSEAIRSRPQLEEEYIALPPEGLEPFSDLSLMNLNRARGPSERFSSAAITANIPDFSNQLIYPPTPNNVVAPSTLKKVFLAAVQQAIQEIIAPVVERSVTIAAISASQLVTKDYAMEGDEEKLRNAAHTVVRRLSGSLALVTCKEPLRMSIMNNIRVMARELPEQALPEGHVLMFVNDNLELVCSTVEQAAEQSSMTEIDLQLEDQMRNRRIFRNTRPNEPFKDANISAWSLMIPEPYRLAPGGLNREQLAIYEEFGQQSRGAPHTNNTSQDSGRQVPDVLQDQFSAVSNLPTPSVVSADPRQGPQQSRLQSLQGAQAGPNQAQLNGYMEPTVQDRPQRNVDEVLHELQKAIKEASEESVADLPPSSPINDLFEELTLAIRHSTDMEHWAFSCAGQITNYLFAEPLRRLEVQVLSRLLNLLCQMSVATSRQVLIWLATMEADDRIYNATVMTCLMEVGLMDLHRLNMIISKAITPPNRRLAAVEMLSSLMDEVLLNEHPHALRAEFALSIDALTDWLAEDPDLEAGKELMAKLQVSPTEQVLTPPATGDDQLDYIFEEWVHLQHPDIPQKAIVAFIYQLHQDKVLETRDKSLQFMRTCLEASIAGYELEMSDFGTRNFDKATIKVDALGQLIVSLVTYHGEDGAVTKGKADYLDTMLMLIILVMNDYHVRQERYKPQVFFRLLSTLLCEFNNAVKDSSMAMFKSELFMVMARAFLVLQPRTFPMFSFQWLALISHRIFIPALLEDAPHDNDTKDDRWDMYAQLVEALLTYTGVLVRPGDDSPVPTNFYRGVLRVFLVIHHDYPEFLAENHFRFCNSLPTHCTQLRNLVVSAYPTLTMDMPDPFSVGLKTDRIDDIRRAPVVRADIDGLLSEAGIKDALDTLLKSSDVKMDNVKKVCAATYFPEPKPAGFESTPTIADPKLIHAIVLYAGMKDLASQGSKGSNFDTESPAAKFLDALAKELRPEARFHLISAIANQLRWPNAHTHYFSYALLHLFGGPSNDPQALELQEVITRVLLERLLVHRPHPWGLIVTLLELLKNPMYDFWELSFVKSAPEVERLLNALFTHAQQSPRALV